MKLSPSSFNENSYYITPSEMIEFNYCQRFIYFMKCLGIEQYEEKRYKVQKGKDVHLLRERQNKNYLRKKLRVIDKEIDVQLVSNLYKIRGKVDEILTLEDNTMAPLDYKFAVYNDKVYDTYRTQIIMYGLMIKEVYDVDVTRGYLIYCRSNNKIVELPITEKDERKLIDKIKQFQDVMQGYYPKATRYKARCDDCCYRNICIK
ncbi:hypothetical protein AN1V17_17190 [Vallitalea sediminicola]